MTNFEHIVASREVSFELLVLDMCNPFPNLLIVSKTRYVLVFDLNALLCAIQHLKSTKAWKPLFLAIRCGEKLVSTWPNSLQFL
jgi:hypothetical protein